MTERNQISNLPTPSVGGLSVYLAQIKILQQTKVNLLYPT